MNINKNVKEVKRAVLGDIASNRLNTTSTNQTNLPKSKLPVLKTGLVSLMNSFTESTFINYAFYSGIRKRGQQ